MIKLHLHVKQHPHVNRMRKRQRVVQLRNLRTNHKVELWYKAELLKLVRQIRGQTEAVILPMLRDLSSQYTKDGYHSDFEDALDRVSNLFGGLRQTAQRLAELAAQRSADQVDSSLKAALQKSVSVDITSALSSGAIAAPMERAVVANIELIKSIPSKYLEKVKAEVYSGASQGVRWESIAEKIQAAGDTTESRAKLIARDQVSKMNSAFNEARQKSLGLEKYIWQTSGDERVRDEHAQNDGKIFSWDDPPETGHPGEDIQCRCVALPYFDLDAEEAKLSGGEGITSDLDEKGWSMNDDGELSLKLHHGTSSDFTDFDLTRIRTGADLGSDSWYGDGVYLTGEEWKARSYALASESPRLVETVTTIKAPLVVEGTGASEWIQTLRRLGIDPELKNLELTNKLKELGFDSVLVYKSDSNKVNELIAFNANQVKVISNKPLDEVPNRKFVLSLPKDVVSREKPSVPSKRK